MYKSLYLQKARYPESLQLGFHTPLSLSCRHLSNSERGDAELLVLLYLGVADDLCTQYLSRQQQADSTLEAGTVISVTEVNLARVPRALEGEVKGGSSLEGAGKGRLWRKG